MKRDYHFIKLALALGAGKYVSERILLPLFQSFSLSGLGVLLLEIPAIAITMALTTIAAYKLLSLSVESIKGFIEETKDKVEFKKMQKEIEKEKSHKVALKVEAELTEKVAKEKIFSDDILEYTKDLYDKCEGLTIDHKKEFISKLKQTVKEYTSKLKEMIETKETKLVIETEGLIHYQTLSKLASIDMEIEKQLVIDKKISDIQKEEEKLFEMFDDKEKTLSLKMK